MKKSKTADPLVLFDPAVRQWFETSFPGPTAAQRLGWPAIASGSSTLILAPTGSGKTLTAFLWCINRLMFSPAPPKDRRCRVLYISPLKALAVDVERNLRAPLAGIAHVASRDGRSFVLPAVVTRTGDTPSSERARFVREAADILITTPESLYLLLTSRARDMLRHVDTVIIDEIHALVPTKRGAHLALSLERLEHLTETPAQRIGLSATQRPLDEVARFLGGVRQPLRRPARRKTKKKAAKLEESVSDLHAEFESPSARANYRPVTIVDTEEKKKLSLRVEVPVDEMAKLGQPIDIPSGPASQGPARTSIWPAIHPRLLALIRQHRSTLIFVNSRRLAERLASALNELAGETIVNAHHGSIARSQRTEIEDRLKSGELPALVATSSLELGIDMGAIDLVIQIEAPPSVASGMQRIGRASHQVGAESRGIIFPKYRGDLVACAAMTRAMHEGRIESIRYPRNPLDVLAQQIVAFVSVDSWNADDLYAAVRGAAPFAELARGTFDGVLDMLSGVYPSDEFAELKPRITWNRIEDSIVAREGAKRVAVINAGTIPDRGLYGVFLAGAEKGGARVGELDEEMVFESRVGETFLLGASTWRIEEITHDRVVVSPAPGQPGKMPFWHGEAAERPAEFGREIGQLVRELRASPPARAADRLKRLHDLEPGAASNLLQYLKDQETATAAVPDDQTLLIERVRDELGDWRICLLSPFGGKILAPWTMAIVAKVRNEMAIDVEALWSDDGLVIRFPDAEAPPDSRLLLPDPDEVEGLVIRQLGSSALFAAKFREVAARALLLPRRRGGARAPLWQQRKRAADLLHVAARFGSFPMLLETYRECLRDIFDLPALIDTMRRIRNRGIHVITVDTDSPSPFASSLLFRYVANYIYEGDAPLAERRAQALSIDQAQLRELLGDAQLRELLDAVAIDEVEGEIQQRKTRIKSADGLQDLMLRVGDLAEREIRSRPGGESADPFVEQLLRERRVLRILVAGESRLIAVEDAARYRDGLGAPIPAGVPERFLRPVRDPLGDLVLRFARTHGPFTSDELAARYGIGRAVAESSLSHYVSDGRIVEGEFRPGGIHREWCDAEVLSAIRRRSLARLRREVEPVEPRTYGRFLTHWHGLYRAKHGVNALLDVIETLQGAPLPASILETEILPARIADYRPSDLDMLTAAGEVVWLGVEPLGERDGRVALFLTDQLPLLWDSTRSPELSDAEKKVVGYLRGRGASFFAPLHEGVGGGFPADTVKVLWDLVWKGLVTNDMLHALRSFTRGATRRTKASSQRRSFRSRRTAPLSSEGRWSLIEQILTRAPTITEKRAALTQQLLSRYGVVPREVANVEPISGGFSAVYEVLKHLEQSGKVRRGYFVSGLAATQFALPGAVDLLRSLREMAEEPEAVLLAATDPGNPYGGVFRWPASEVLLTRSVGAQVILVNGGLVAYVARGGKQLMVRLPEEEPTRSVTGHAVAALLAKLVEDGKRRAILISEIESKPADEHPLAEFLLAHGFVSTAQGLQLRSSIGSFEPVAPGRLLPNSESLEGVESDDA